MTYKIVALCIIAFLLAACYSVLVVASREDERAERMHEEWRRKHEQMD